MTVHNGELHTNTSNIGVVVTMERMKLTMFISNKEMSIKDPTELHVVVFPLAGN